jgi:hypothetical protein
MLAVQTRERKAMTTIRERVDEVHTITHEDADEYHLVLYVDLQAEEDDGERVIVLSQAALDELTAHCLVSGGYRDDAWRAHFIRERCRVLEQPKPKPERRCTRCGILASEAAKQAESFCNDGGLVGAHRFEG